MDKLINIPLTSGGAIILNTRTITSINKLSSDSVYVEYLCKDLTEKHNFAIERVQIAIPYLTICNMLGI